MPWFSVSGAKRPGRPAGRGNRVPQREWSPVMDTAERNLMLLVGDIAVPRWLQDRLAEIADPMRLILRRIGMRDGVLPPRDDDK